MKKKGFTLIELLAVIVILAIIALIATPMIMNVIEKARRGAAEESGNGYIEAVDWYQLQERLDSNMYQIPTNTIIKVNECTTTCLRDVIEVKGDKPRGTEDYIKLNTKGIIETGKLTFGNYEVTIKNGKVENVNKVGEVTPAKTTPESCFQFGIAEDGEAAILDYTCSDTDIVIPDSVEMKVPVFDNATFNVDKCKRVYQEYSSNMSEEDLESECDTMNEQIPLVSENILRRFVVEGEREGLLVGEMFDNLEYTDMRLKVTAIGQDDESGAKPFVNKSLTSVVIPNTVKAIWWDAFKNNQLTSVVIPDSVTEIGPYAFANNQLTSIVIPNGVTRITGYAFANNQLTSVVIPNSVTLLFRGAFMNNQLTSVVIPDSITTIYDSTFSGNQLTNIEIPSNVTVIEGGAFENNQLTSVKIHNIKDNVQINANYLSRASFGWASGYSDTNIDWLG